MFLERGGGERGTVHWGLTKQKMLMRWVARYLWRGSVHSQWLYSRPGPSRWVEDPTPRCSSPPCSCAYNNGRGEEERGGEGKEGKYLQDTGGGSNQVGWYTGTSCALHSTPTTHPTPHTSPRTHTWSPSWGEPPPSRIAPSQRPYHPSSTSSSLPAALSSLPPTLSNTHMTSHDITSHSMALHNIYMLHNTPYILHNTHTKNSTITPLSNFSCVTVRGRTNN